MLVLAQLVAAGVAKSPGDHIICKHGTSAGDNFRWHMVGDVTGKQLATMALSPAPQWRRHRRIVGDKGCVASTSMVTSPAHGWRNIEFIGRHTLASDSRMFRILNLPFVIRDVPDFHISRRYKMN